MIMYARRELAAAGATPHDVRAAPVLAELTVAEAWPVRRVGAAMNLLGDLTAVDIDAPDLDFEPDGWQWRSAALSELIGSLHQRVDQIQAALARPEATP
ncbi:hypothetical protein [Glycomyces sp. MUSA5-2]|uniref:hypothetical protein n=1 Tax=Glycomyces sp. MUSA5-2 TaxID=2053002 RepID=UPI003008298D